MEHEAARMMLLQHMEHGSRLARELTEIARALGVDVDDPDVDLAAMVRDLVARVKALEGKA